MGEPEDRSSRSPSHDNGIGEHRSSVPDFLRGQICDAMESKQGPPILYHVHSQSHLLRVQEHNPTPTTMPPPTAGLGGAFGERYVISFIGLPARGKMLMARRLTRYLRFFHGVDCTTPLFAINAHQELRLYPGTGTGSHGHAARGTRHAARGTRIHTHWHARIGTHVLCTQAHSVHMHASLRNLHTARAPRTQHTPTHHARNTCIH